MSKAATFLKLNNWMHETVRVYSRKYHANPEDLYDESVEVFMSSFNTFDDTKGASIETWIKRKIQFGLMEAVRRNAVHNRRYPKQTFDGIEIPSRPKFNLERFKFELSEDAATVIDLLIEEVDRFRSSAGWKNFVRHTLSQMGWDEMRISGVFVEIAEAL